MTATQKIIFLGTGSDVGKSITTTAFCRILKNRGFKVAPFKAQNMSNNSYVTMEGGEIGRAQVAQAEAAGCLPSVHMNPVLLKPSSDIGAQVVVLGQARDTMPARDYYAFKDDLRKIVSDSFNTLAADYDAIVMEGAGSCAEVNLRQNDIVNFDLALSVNAPVVLVADIDRGGVFAQIIGSLEVISQSERDLVAGFIINKFRGDPRLFDDGIAYIEQHTGKPVLGLVPVYQGFSIDTEDSMSLDAVSSDNTAAVAGKINIAVVRVPHVSNFTDIDALNQEPEVNLVWLTAPRQLSNFAAVIIPGSKSVIHDMAALHRAGWTDALKTYVKESKGLVVGLCGGYQMLGNTIADPLGIEGGGRDINGLGLLDIDTQIEPIKRVSLSQGQDRVFKAPVRGYEIHMGQSRLGGNASLFVDLDGQAEGAISPDERIWGTYLHGLFDSGAFRKAFLSRLSALAECPFDAEMIREDYWRVKERNYDLLAAHFEKYTQVDRILSIMRAGCKAG